VLRFDHVDIEIIIGKNGASRRRNAYRDAPDVQLIDHFGDEPMGDAVAASRTVVKDCAFHTLRSAKNLLHVSALMPPVVAARPLQQCDG
jgi:hypothetical protein